MAGAAYSRSLGNEPGIQLNPKRDASDGTSPDFSDQAFAMALRLPRGRIDVAFPVNISDAERRVGRTGSIRASAVNEGRVQLLEMLRRGAKQGILSRLVKAGAVNNYVIATQNADGTITWSLDDELPETYLLAFKHLECFGDGAVFQLHADANPVAGVDQPATAVTVRVREPNGNLIFEQAGSLDVSALDDFQRSAFLPDVIETAYETPDVEVYVFPGATIPVNSVAYGRAANGTEKVASSGVQLYFTEGDTAYTVDDYAAACARLRGTQFQYRYVASGGTQSTALLSQLAQLAFDRNTPLKYDIAGSLSPAQAVAFRNQLGFDSDYCHAYWSPNRCDDPVNGGKAVLGTSGLNVAFSCARNAIKDARGFAALNQPIAGKDYPVARTGMKQIYDPSSAELSDLAKAHINPVLFTSFNGGGAYVFTDCLTNAISEASYRKLTTVSDMSSNIDDTICKAFKEFLLLPMAETIKRGNRFLQRLFEGARAAGWLVPSEELNGEAFTFEVSPDPLRPVDRVKVRYSLRYDGVTRQIEVTQTISR